MARRKVETTYWAADTENTVPKSAIYEQDEISEEDAERIFAEACKEMSTMVWGAGLCRVDKDVSDSDVELFDTTNGSDTMANFLRKCRELPGRPVIYFHNFAYDGKFLVTELLKLGYVESSRSYGDPERGEYKQLVTGDGIWYSLKVRFAHNSKVVEFRDSMKILPFSVDNVAKQLKTKAQKLKGSIDYAEERLFGHRITETEGKYLRNDILVMAEALAMVSEYGLLEYLTIGSRCMHDYMERFGGGSFKKGKRLFKDTYFPELTGDLDADLRLSYKGAFCYNNTDGSIIRPAGGKGYVYDVNSLYPSVMYNHMYPVGYPMEYDGVEFYDHIDQCYIVHGSFWFSVKPGHIPFVQIKHNRWRDNEYIRDSEGYVELTLTRPDYELLMEQYDMVMEPYIDKCWVFQAYDHLFNDYIDYWYNLKANAPNKVIRLICKLMLNNLYGKFATSPYKTQAHFQLDKNSKLVITSTSSIESPVYIPVGSFITAYARGVTVRAAQKNYEHFLYADTDSLHLDAPADGIEVDAKKLGAWKNESNWSVARFVRQKTYVELTIEEDGEPCDPYLNIKACGASEAVKERMLYRVTRYEYKTDERGRHEVNHRFFPIKKDENDHIINERRDNMEVIERFTYGLKEAGKLAKKTVSGGCILSEVLFSINY